MLKNITGLSLMAALVLSFSISSEARIRLRKVKEAARTCALMQEDKLLSRPDKKVLSTERHSLVFEDTLSLVRDKGEKVCAWRPSEFESLGALDQFHFYIDEYKEVLYSYVQNPTDNSYLIITTPFATCSLETRVTLPKFDPPVCAKPKGKSSKKRKKKKTA